MIQFYPEGKIIDSQENLSYIESEARLREAMNQEVILEGRAVLCDSEHNLHIEFPTMAGIIPYLEGAIGIEDGTTRDIAIISRVGKPVCFIITGFEVLEGGGKRAILSRKAAQEKCVAAFVSKLSMGDIISAKITRLETFGAFCDIGCGLPALIPIASLSISRIAHPSDRLSVGMEVLGAVSSIDEGKICLSQKELLGTWLDNAKLFKQGETVSGIVRSVEPYGIFIELTPNLAGLAEPKEGVYPGQHTAAYIKSIISEKMKLKLVIIDVFNGETEPEQPRYFIDKGRIDRWVYSPENSDKIIETVFSK